MIAKDSHTHKFTEPVPKKVRVYNADPMSKAKDKRGGIAALDTLKQFKCSCGEVITSDLERQRV